jgi:hypothetical protein
MSILGKITSGKFAQLAIILIIGLIIFTYFLPQVWDELKDLARIITGR